MFECYLCRNNTRMSISTGFFCKNCKVIQDLISIHGDRVYEILEEVLTRSADKQNNKIKLEIKKEIDHKNKILSEKKNP